MVRDALAECLAGYGVESVERALDAFDSLEEMSFDLVIPDINMPGLDGIDFYNKAAEAFPYIKDRFLFMTGDHSGEFEAASVFLPAGGRILKKPFTRKDLLKRVEGLLMKG